MFLKYLPQRSSRLPDVSGVAIIATYVIYSSWDLAYPWEIPACGLKDATTPAFLNALRNHSETPSTYGMEGRCYIFRRKEKKNRTLRIPSCCNILVTFLSNRHLWKLMLMLLLFLHSFLFEIVHNLSFCDNCVHLINL